MNSYVLYHSNCNDGSGAAYSAWKVLGDAENIHYIPVNHQEKLPEIESGNDVYILDFSYSRDVLVELKDRSNKLVILDHHKTAMEDLKDFPGATFDMEQSGAVLAWKYFHPNHEVPQLLKHIQDRDLWRKEIEGTEQITSALALHSDFRGWDNFVQDPQALSALRHAGEVKRQFDEIKLNKISDKASIVKYGNHKCALINTTTLVSDVGSRLYNELPVDFALSYFIDFRGDVVFSFRSKGSFDVGALAKALGGGGHRNASGAKVKSSDGFELLRKLYASAT